MSEPSRAVFLSYASQDAEPARRICGSLRAAGVEVWFDQNELRGGDVWDRQIRRQIQDCALFIALISVNSQERLEGYFRREWKLAVDRSHDMAEEKPFIIPVVIDGTLEPDCIVPDKFREVQWTRLPDGEPSGAFVERVAQLLAPGLPRPDPLRSHAAAISPPKAPDATSTKRSFRWAAVAVIAVLSVMAAAYVALQRRGASNDMSGRHAGSAAIAVLPFVDLSEKHDQEYFADGMAEEILNLLVKIPNVKVIGRSSSFQFKGKADDLRAIGASLGVPYLVEGSVRRAGDRVRVTAELIDARDGTHRWSDSYDREISDVLKVQDEIATSVARALQLSVDNMHGDDLTAVTNPEAYSQYLIGLHAFDSESYEGCQDAIAAFQRGLDLQPNFAKAALGIASAYQIIGENGWDSTTVVYEKARQAATLAIRLDPTLGAAHARLANVHTMYDWDWAAADSEIKQAEKLGAGVEGTLAAAHLAAALGDWDKAIQLFKKGIAVDPLNPELHGDLGYEVYLRSGQYKSAEASLRRTLDISPHFGAGEYFLGLALMFQGRLEEALAAFKVEERDLGNNGSAHVYYTMGRIPEADAALEKSLKWNDSGWASGIAEIYAFRGDADKAMYWLNRAYEQKDPIFYIIKHDRLLKNLEGDPRYVALLSKLNQPE